MIYADHAATTRLDPEVLRAMLPYMTDVYANPSGLHSASQDAREAVEHARITVADCLGCASDEIFFTSGGSESDTQAILSAAYAGAKRGKRHVVSTAFEHPAVLNTLSRLASEGFVIQLLPVGSLGTVSADEVNAAIRDDTCLVSCMYANNEIGSVLPVGDIGRVCRERGVLFHTDAVQAAGQLHIGVKEQNIDLLSLSAHKFHGPKGVGVLYAKRGTELCRLVEGGGQERGFRPGTENVPAVVGLAEALKRTVSRSESDMARLVGMRDALLRELSHIPGAHVNGDTLHRLPGNVSVSFEGVDGESLVLLLDTVGICASAGSACASGSGKPSHVLLALGLSPDLARGTLRLSLDTDNTEEDVRRISEEVPHAVARLRACAGK